MYSWPEHWMGVSCHIWRYPMSICSRLTMLILVAHLKCCLTSPMYNYCVLSPLQQTNSLLGRTFKVMQRYASKVPPRISIQWWFLPDPAFTMMVANEFPTPVLTQNLSFGSWRSTVSKRPPPPYLFVHLSIHWTHEFLNYSVVYSSLLLLIILVLRMFRFASGSSFKLAPVSLHKCTLTAL